MVNSFGWALVQVIFPLTSTQQLVGRQRLKLTYCKLIAASVTDKANGEVATTSPQMNCLFADNYKLLNVSKYQD